MLAKTLVNLIYKNIYKLVSAQPCWLSVLYAVSLPQLRYDRGTLSCAKSNN